MEAPKRPHLYSGTSNIVVPLRQADFPPEYKGASRLTYYASLFSSIEINATFYKLPKPITVQKWAESVPDDFRFTFKVPKAITHEKGLRYDSSVVTRFAEVVAAVGAKKGCLLVQFPPSVKRERQEEVDALLDSLRLETEDWKIAVEFRDPGWHAGAVYRMLQQYDAAMVEQDFASSPSPNVQVSDAFSYLRYHGPEGGSRGSYDDEKLQRDAQRIVRELGDGREVYVYFNNTLGAALNNLQTLNRMVGELLT